MKEMTNKQRIITTIRHEEPDRVPISPRLYSWLQANHGGIDLATHMKYLPDMDFMFIIEENTPNYLETYPDEYNLPDVTVDQKKYKQDDLIAVERTFHTPAGALSDRTLIPPANRVYGLFPNPIKTEYLVKSPADLERLPYILPAINTNYDYYHDHVKQISDRGVIMVGVRSALDHHAGYARDMEHLMMDYYDDRAFLKKLLAIFHQRCLAQTKAALESGVQFIFSSWYFASLSSGWSPKIYEEIFLPLLKEHVDLVHSYDAYYDYYDDGNLNDTMENIAAAGVDILETCTPPPVGDFDLDRAKQEIGSRSTIKGYIDLLEIVRNGTPEIIRNEVARAMDIAKPGGGFIIGSSDSFREDTPNENVAAYFRACKEFGRY